MFLSVTGLCLAAHGLTAVAQPWTPTVDEQVIAVIPASASARALREATRASREGNVTISVALARAYIERARGDADPRWLGIAEGLLAPWRDAANVPPDVLFLQATVLQARHRFDEALRVLDRLLAVQPRHAQGWLTRANILRVQGRLPEALVACAQLDDAAASFIGEVCALDIAGLSGDPATSLQALRSRTAAAAHAPPAVRAWYYAVLADQLERSGFAEADRAYRLGLEADHGDLALRASYCDFLVGQGRSAEVLRLTHGYERVDFLQLRRLIALRHLGRQDLDAVRALAESFAAARRRHEELHLREEGLFLLAVVDEPRKALRAAQANWKVQREPVDARLMARAAMAANDTVALAALREDLAKMGLRDVQVASLRVRP